MLEFIRSAYRGFVLIGFWANLVLFTIAGGVVGKMLSSRHDDNTGVGVFFGLAVGFIVAVQMSGFIITILNIDKNIEKLVGKRDNTFSSNVQGYVGKMVTPQEVDLYDGPGHNYNHIVRLGKNFPIMIKQIKGDWALVVLEDGRKGWCKTSSQKKGNA